MAKLAIPQILVAYADLISGTRSYYAQREGDDWVAAFSAAMLLSFLFMLNISAVIVLADLLVHRELKWVSWIALNRVVLLPVPIGIGALHVLLTKKIDNYWGTNSKSWAHKMRIYMILTVCNVVLPLFLLILKRYSGIYQES